MNREIDQKELRVEDCEFIVNGEVQSLVTMRHQHKRAGYRHYRGILSMSGTHPAFVVNDSRAKSRLTTTYRNAGLTSEHVGSIQNPRFGTSFLPTIH